MIYTWLVCVNMCPCCSLNYLLQKDAERWVRLLLLRLLRMAKAQPWAPSETHVSAGHVLGAWFCGASRAMGCAAMQQQDQGGIWACRTWHGALVRNVPPGVLGRSATLLKGGGASNSRDALTMALVNSLLQRKITNVASGRKIRNSKHWVLANSEVQIHSQFCLQAVSLSQDFWFCFVFYIVFIMKGNPIVPGDSEQGIPQREHPRPFP